MILSLTIRLFPYRPKICTKNKKKAQQSLIGGNEIRIHDSMYNGEYEINESVNTPQLGNVAATLLNLLGYEKPTHFMESLIKFK